MYFTYRGSAIKAFNIWPADSDYHINVPGKISAVCTDGKTTNFIAYGANGTDMNGQAKFCKNSTQAMQKKDLKNYAWDYRFVSFAMSISRSTEYGH